MFQFLDIIKNSWGVVLAALPPIQAFLSILNSSLDAGKLAKELLNSGSDAIVESQTDSNALERARAASELMRSYAIFAALKVILHLGFMASIILLYRELTNGSQRVKR